jgi:hypothetical protein
LIEVKFPNDTTQNRDNFRAVWDALKSHLGMPYHAGFEEGQPKTYVFRYNKPATNDVIATVYKLCRKAIVGNFGVRRLNYPK